MFCLSVFAQWQDKAHKLLDSKRKQCKSYTMNQWFRALQQCVEKYDVKLIRDLIEAQPKKMEQIIARDGRRVD